MTLRPGFLATLLMLPALALAEPAGQIHVVVGSAQLIDSAGKQRSVERGTEVSQGDRIVTGDNALVQMKLSDGTYLSVRTNTDVVLDQYHFDKQSPEGSGMLLKLARGALRSITGLIGSRNPDAYKVNTPIATIGIRGTDHEPVFIPEPKPGETPIGTPGTYDKVNSGATFIQTNSGIANIRPGQVGFVPITAAIVPTILPNVPDFFKRFEQKGDGMAARDGKRPTTDKTELRPTVRMIGTARTIDPAATETLRTAPAEGVQVLVAPTTTFTTINASSPEIAPTLSTTPTISPTLSTSTTTTISPTLSPTTTVSPLKTISPTLSPTTTTLTR